VFIIRGRTFVYANEALARMLGTTTEDLILHDFRDFIVPEDRDWVIDRGLRRQHGEKVPESYEFKLLKRDGTTRVDVVIDAGLIQYEGETASMGTIRDITEWKRAEESLKKSEEQYRRLMQRSFDAIVVHRNGIISFANQAAVALLGASSPAEVIGKKVLDFVHPAYQDRVRKRIAEMTSADGMKTVDVAEEQFLKLDGSTIETEVVAVGFSDEEGPQSWWYSVTSPVVNRWKMRSGRAKTVSGGFSMTVLLRWRYSTRTTVL